MELPDVNLLLNLLDPSSKDNAAATNWFSQAKETGWATCPLTENGFIRIASSPTYLHLNLSVAQAIAALDTLIVSSATAHAFWPDDISLRDRTVFNPTRLIGHKQITDAYLLGLCQKHGATLVTFDRRIDRNVLVSPHSNIIRVL